jgi:ferrochelatase
MPEKELKISGSNTCFVSDCLETLEEIAMEANHEFKVHGGEEFLQFHV